MVFLLYFTAFMLVLHVRHLRGEWINSKIGDGNRRHAEFIKMTDSRKQHFHVRIGIACAEKISFKIVPETGLFRLLKKIGLADEFQAGDDQIDKMLFIGDDTAMFKELMRSSHALNALRILTTSHDNIQIRAQGKNIWLEADGVSAGWLDTHRQNALIYLWEIAHAAEKITAEQCVTTRFSPAQRAAFFMALHATFLTGGIYSLIGFGFDHIHTENKMPLIVMGLGLVPLAAGMWFLFMKLALRRSMWLVAAAADFIFIGLVGITLMLPLLTIEANQKLPQGTPTTLEKTLIGKQCFLKCKRRFFEQVLFRRGYATYIMLSEQDCRPEAREEKLKEMKEKFYRCRANAEFKYQLAFSPWYRDDKKLYVPHVSAEIFDASTTGDVFTVPVYPGALGIRWVNESELRPAKHLNTQR